MPSKRGKIFLFVIGVFLFVVVFGWQFKSFRWQKVNSQKIQNAPQITFADTVPAGGREDSIPSIADPRFESVLAADQYLNNDGIGIVALDQDVWKFFPYQILVWHQAVHDVFGTKPVIISYNPLTFFGVIFSRETQDSVLQFGVSDRVYNNSVLLYDRATHSFWDPLLGKAILGEKSGSLLEIIPSVVMTWSEFKSFYQNGRVLSRETGFTRDYTHDPYTSYYHDQRILFPMTYKNDRLFSKEMVYGLKTTKGWIAYRATYVEDKPVLKKELREQNAKLIYWFAWSAAHPETELIK